MPFIRCKMIILFGFIPNFITHYTHMQVNQMSSCLVLVCSIFYEVKNNSLTFFDASSLFHKQPLANLPQRLNWVVSSSFFLFRFFLTRLVPQLSYTLMYTL